MTQPPDIVARSLPHLRWALASGSVAGLVLGAALLAHVLVLAPHMLTRSGAPLRTVLGVLGASCGSALVPALLLASLIGVISARRAWTAAATVFAYRTLTAAIPLATLPVLWFQFGVLEGQLSVASVMQLGVALLLGLGLTGLLALRFLRVGAFPRPPSWLWLGVAAALVPCTLLPRPLPIAASADVAAASRRAAPEASSLRDRASAVVLITVDTLRADHIGAYGYGRDTTPFLDRYAAEGVLVERMVAATSCTVPSSATILTGAWPWCTRVEEQAAKLPQALTTLAERFRDAGYRTIGVVANPLLDRSAGFAQGFDAFHNPARGAPYPGAVEVNAAALERIDDARGPFFLWVHYMEPHYPYLPPESDYAGFLRDVLYDPTPLPVIRIGALGGVHRRNVFLDQDPGRSVEAGLVVARYDGEIRRFDRALEALVRALDDRGLLEDAALALTADHGETLTGHEQYFQHCQDVYDSTIHVPALFWRRGDLPGGRRLAGPAAHVDIAPTLLAIAGVDAGDGPALPGIDLSDPGTGAEAGRPVFAQTGWWDGGARALLGVERLRATRALVEGDWKYVKVPTHELAQVRGPLSLLHAWRASLVGLWRGDALYNLAADPRETNDLSSAEPDRAERMSRRLATHPDAAELARCPFEIGAPAEFDAEELEQRRRKLRALGYVD